MSDDTTNPDRVLGEQVRREVLGVDNPPITDAFREISTDHLFGRVWSRPGLSIRDRRLVTLTVIAMTGQGAPLKFHIGAAYKSGDFTIDELDEWVLHVAHYAGWPIATTAYAALREVEAAGAGDAGDG